MRSTTPTSSWSVRTFLVSLVLACLLPGVIGATAVFVNEYRESRAQQKIDTLNTARALVQAVDNHLLRVQTIAQVLAGSELLTERDLAAFHARARQATSLAGLDAKVVLRNETGQKILDTAVDFGTPLRPAPVPGQVREVFPSGEPSFSGLFVDPVQERPLMSVHVPVWREGRIIYALGIDIPPEHLDAILQVQRLPADWIAGVFDSTGTVVARSQDAERFVGSKAPAPLLEAMTLAHEGVAEVTSFDSAPMMSHFSRSPVTKLSVVIGIPRADFAGMLGRTLPMLAVGAAALFGIGFALARVVSERIARSVEALTAPAEALGRGEPARVPEVGIREAAEVALAIGRASDLLQAREAELAQAHRLARFSTWYWDLASGQLTSSDSMREIYGREVPSFPEQRGTLLPVDSWKRLRAAAQRALHSGSGFELELRVNHGDGYPICVKLQGEAVRNDKGEVIGLRGAIQDISAQRAVAEELRKFKFFSDHANDGHLILDESGHIRYANRLACERLGYDERELLALSISDIDPRYPEMRFHEFFARSKEARTPPFESLHRRKDGSTFPVEITATVLQFDDEWLMFATSRDISGRKLIEQRVRDAALHDALTGLPNRALVFEYGNHLTAAARRGHGGGALLFIDLDRFKPINDLHGHDTGDHLLQEVSARLMECTRHEDLVGRLGGDEFVIVLPYLEGGRPRAAVVARHVIERLSAPFNIDGHELSITPSIGIAHYPEHAGDIGALIHAADLAMYQVKQTGRANYHFYTQDLDRRADEAASMEARLKAALRHGGLKLHYQPVIDIKSGRPSSVEALVRLAADDGEPVSPASFIPIAESAGLIDELGEWVACEACRQYEAWRQQGLKIRIAINVSPLQFRRRGFAEKLSSIITATGMDPAYLEIEVTESTVMESIDDAVQILNSLKSLGVKVALDDFGTGHSSLANLSSLPLDKLKVDQSFVRRVERDEASRAVTEAIIALGHSLKLDVVGEGIESESTLRYLAGRGCNLAQGYWFSRPLPACEFAQWYRAQHFH